MGEQRELFQTPLGLSRKQLQRLTELADTAGGAPASDLLVQVAAHEEQARLEHANNPLVNVRLANAIFETFVIVVKVWDELPHNTQYWLRGAMLYFVSCDDDEPDFRSAIGFEDDCEVLNAFLQIAGREDLCLKPEDFDDA